MNHKIIQSVFFLTLLALTSVVVFLIVRPFIGSLVLAFALAVVFFPMFRAIRNLFKGKAALASLLSVFIILFVFLVPMTFLSIQVFKEGRGFYFNIITRTDQSQSVLHDKLISTADFLSGNNEYIHQRAEDFSANIYQYLKQALVWLLEHTGEIFSSITKIIFNLFITMIALFFVFKDGKELKNRIVQISPLSNRYDIDITNRIEKTVSAVVKGIIIVALVQALMAGIGFTLFGIPNPALWGMTAMIAAFIPGVGTAVVMVPAVLYLFFTGHIGAGIGLAIWGTFAVGLIDNFLSPLLLGRGVKMHTFIVLLSVLGGLARFGPIGFLLGPMIVSFLFALLEIYPSIIGQENKAAEQNAET